MSRTYLAFAFGTLVFPLLGLLFGGPVFLQTIPLQALLGTSLTLGVFTGFLIHTA